MASSIQSDPFSAIVKAACQAAIAEAIGIVGSVSPRRLLSVAATAVYLDLSEREVYNIVANHELASVRHGKRVMLDIRDLDEWIVKHKEAA
jgi:excisionase family DNA binding protein